MKKIITILLLMFSMLGFSMPTLDEAVVNLRNAGLTDEAITSYVNSLQIQDANQKIAYLENIVKQNPQNIYAKMDLASLYILTNQSVDKANEIVQYLSEGTILDPTNEFPYEKLLEFYSITGQNDRVVEVLNNMLNAIPEYPLSYYYAINYLMFQNDVNSAVALIPVAIERFENTPPRYISAYENRNFYINDLRGAYAIVLAASDVQAAVDYYNQYKTAIDSLPNANNVKELLIRRNEEEFKKNNRKVYNANLKILRK